MKKIMKSIKVIVCGIVILSIPIILSVTVYNLVIKGYIPNENWISIYSSIIGGITTLVGLIITIGYNNNKDNNNDIKKIKPYLIVDIANESINSVKIEEEIENSKNTFKKLEYNFFDGDVKNEKKIAKLYKTRIFGKIMNVGLGTCTDIFIYDFKIGKHPFNANSYNGYRVIPVNDEIYIHIKFLDGYMPIYNHLVDENFKKELVNYKKKIQQNPKVKFEFSLIYTDLLENTYKQKVCLDMCVHYRDNSFKGIPIFNNISEPIMMKKSEARRIKADRIDKKPLYYYDKYTKWFK